MSFIFNMHKTQVTFSLTLILKVRILDIPNFQETSKGTWYHKMFEEHG